MNYVLRVCKKSNLSLEIVGLNIEYVDWCVLTVLQFLVDQLLHLELTLLHLLALHHLLSLLPLEGSVYGIWLAGLLFLGHDWLDSIHLSVGDLALGKHAFFVWSKSIRCDWVVSLFHGLLSFLFEISWLWDDRVVLGRSLTLSPLDSDGLVKVIQILTVIQSFQFEASSKLLIKRCVIDDPPRLWGSHAILVVV